MRNFSIWTLAWRSLAQHRLRSILSAFTVALGVGMVIAAKVAADGMGSLIEIDESMVEFMTIMLEVIFSIIGSIILGVAGFLIFNAFAMSVTQRNQQIGMMRALGATRKQIRKMLIAESILLGGVGVMLGMGLGPILGNVLLLVMNYYGAGVGSGSISPTAMIIGAALGMLISVISVLIPARRATRISPLAAIRQDVSDDSPNISRNRAILGTVIMVGMWSYLVLAPPGKWTGNHQPWDLILPNLLFFPWLIGITLLLPALVGWFQRPVRTVLAWRLGAVGRLIADNLGRDRPRVILTILTFAIGIAMMVGLNGIITFSNAVLLETAAGEALSDQAWFLNPFDRTSGLAQFEVLGSADPVVIEPEVLEDVYTSLDGRAGVGEMYVVTIPAISAPIPGFPSIVASTEMLRRPKAFKFSEGNWKQAGPIMDAGCGVLLPPGVAVNIGADVGDEIILSNTNHNVECTVAGLGTGGMLASPLLSMAARDAFDLGINPSTLSIWPLEGADIIALEDDLRALAARHEGKAWITTPAEELQSVLDVSDQLEGITYGMLAMAVFAAALGMVNTTMMSVLQRKPELGVLRGVGATQRQTTLIIIGEAALTGLLGSAVGLIAGLGMTVINAVTYGGLRFSIQDLDLWASAWKTVLIVLPAGLWGLLLTPIISAATAWFPARMTLREKPMDILGDLGT